MTTQMKICTGFFEWLHYVKCKFMGLFKKSKVEELEDPYISKLFTVLNDDSDNKKND